MAEEGQTVLCSPTGNSGGIGYSIWGHFVLPGFTNSFPNCSLCTPEPAEKGTKNSEPENVVPSRLDIRVGKVISVEKVREEGGSPPVWQRGRSVCAGWQRGWFCLVLCHPSPFPCASPCCCLLAPGR